MVFVDGVDKLVHAYLLNVEKVAEVVDAYLSVAAVRKCASEPGIVVERVVDVVCAGWGRLVWPAGVICELGVVRCVYSVRRRGPAGRSVEGGRTGGDGATGREGGGEPPGRMCWTAALRMSVAVRDVAVCGRDVYAACVAASQPVEVSRGGRTGGDGATGREGGGEPPARMCWTAALRMFAAVRDVAVCGRDVLFVAGGWSSAFGKGRGRGRLYMRTNGQ